MSVYVRFAPSPTGRIHVGNVRAALINYLFARSEGGKFLLRLDDTDAERSTEEFAQGIQDDLTWLGLNWDETAKQSDRFDRYNEVIEGLKADGRLYACYETPDELELKRKIQRASGKPPVYDRAALSLSGDEIAAFEAEGRKPHWRFKLSEAVIEWDDLVQGHKAFDLGTLSDPVLIRADGTPLYTLPSVVDDLDMGITHVIRGEDHVTNTAVQIDIINHLGGTPQTFAHYSLLTGAKGEGLSKRLGSLSIRSLRDEEGLEPEAIISLLARLGTSDPIEPMTSIDQAVSGFGIDRLSRSPAKFDPEELKALNAKILHALDHDQVKDRAAAAGVSADLWDVARANIDKLSDLADWVQIVEGPVTPVIEDADFIAEAAALLPEGDFGPNTWKDWTAAVKDKTGAKGKGLFMPLRLALTGRPSGPELGDLLSLIGPERAQKRLKGETA